MIFMEGVFETGQLILFKPDDPEEKVAKYYTSIKLFNYDKT